MADRFTDEATSTLSPVFDSQIGQLQSQVPAIQQLFQSLSSGLTQQSNAQLNTGVQNISEDASARGVLRSTLPVDARTTLTGQLGAALTQGLGQLNLQELGQVGDIQSKIGTLGINKATSIADLSNNLRTSDLQERQFQEQKLVDAQNYQLAQQKIAQASASTGLSPAEVKSQVQQSIAGGLSGNKGKDGYVSNETWAAALTDWQAIGGTPRTFFQTYAQYVNPKFKESYAGWSAR